MDSPRKHRSPKPRLQGVKDKLRDDEGRTVLSRLHALFPRHGPSASSPLPVDEEQGEKEAPYEHALKVRIISWNMNDTVPKGNLDALLGEVPKINNPDGPNPAASDFEFEDNAHPCHIIVVAGQECPTGLLPMGMGAVKMDRSKDKDKSKSKKDEDGLLRSKSVKPRRSEEEEIHLLTDTPLSGPAYQPSTTSLASANQHTSGWSNTLEDYLCKGRQSQSEPLIPSSPMSERQMLPPPSPTPSRSPTLPPVPLTEGKKTPLVPPSPRRMNTFLNGHAHGYSRSNGHYAWDDPGAVGPYVLVAKERLMGIYLAVYVHRDTRPMVRGVSKSSVTAGLIGGRLGNKGGVGISMNVAGRSFLFVNAHLAAHEGRQAMRIENMEKIQAELRLDNFGEPLYPRKPVPDPAKQDITNQFDYTWVFGDLNFRLDVSRLHADWLISRQEYLRAQEFDELRNNMRSNKLFPGFEEPVIDFPPTFKYDVPKSRHHSRKDAKEKDRGVRASIRAARRSRKRDKDKTQALQSPKSPKVLKPLPEQVESGGSSSDLEQEDGEDESDGESYTSSQPYSQSQPNLKPRPASSRSQPTLPGSSDGESGSDERGESFVHANTQANAQGGLGRMLSRSAKKGWKVLVKAGVDKEKRVDRKRGVSSGPEVVLTIEGASASGLSMGMAEMARAKSQPNLVIDTDVEVERTRASMDGGRGSLANGNNGLLSPVAGGFPTSTGPIGGLAPPPMIRAYSSTASSMGPEGELEDHSVKGVYDTSSKQRVPSWCDRIVYKSTVLSPQPPPSLTLAPFPPPLTEEDSRFRVGNILTGMRRKGSRGRKDSFPIPVPRVRESGTAKTREALLAETRASPFLKQPGETDESSVSERPALGPRPGSGKRPGSSGTTGDSPASMQWPRTNPFARLLHPHLHQGPGLIHAVSMEPEPQPLAGLGLPRPRSLSTSEGRVDDEAPAPPPKDDVPRWWFFRQRQPTRESAIVAEPEPEAEPVKEDHKRGDIVCISYGTLDDKAMQRLGGRSDHRPVLGTYAVYI